MKASRIFCFAAVTTFLPMVSGSYCESSASCADLFSRQDAERVELLMQRIDKYEKNVEFLQERFYRIINRPLSLVSGCQIQKRLGGSWRSTSQCTDGSKVVCIEKIMKSIENDTCLVYSFAREQNSSFEETMAELGCQVRVFRPNIDESNKTEAKIKFYRRALECNSKPTLDDIIEMNNDQEKEITVLKLDAKRSYIDCLIQWSKSGILENVQQISVEMQMDGLHEASILASLIRTFQNLHTSGFRLVSYNPIVCHDLKGKKDHKTHFDVVFVRES